jgi:hypothetical protein
MESSEMIVQAANLLIHHTNGANTNEQILGIETLICDDKVYQLQVCLVPKHAELTASEAKFYEGVETSYMLNKAQLVNAMQKIRMDKGLGEYTDIKYTVQYLFVQGFKYILELRMTATNPQLIQFEQLN